MKVKNFREIKLHKIHNNRNVLCWEVVYHIKYETRLTDFTLFEAFVILIPEYRLHSNIITLTRRYAIFFEESIDSLSCGMIWEQPNENYEF